MSNETEQRLAELEKEVHALRIELNELKGVKPVKTTIKQNEDVKSVPIPIRKVEETTSSDEQTFNHLVQLNKGAKEKLNSPAVGHLEQINQQKETVNKSKPAKEHKSFEELVMWALPKIFMVILVLGVLWGLKLISDYGLFSNALKLILAYLLSIALIVIPSLMEKRKEDPSQIFTVVLYGGAFIIGILTTAAGAILYDLLNLYVSLMIAILYIAFGILISYLKKNEVLSTFVIFTSLLLPYLLEYMEFNGIVILLYVVLVFSAMQWVFVKHTQKAALYIAYFFSIVAVQVIWSLNLQDEIIYLLSYVILNCLFLIVWWRLYDATSKFKTVHEGLLFSFSGLTLFMINVLTDQSELALFLLTLFFAYMAILAYKLNQSRIVDIVGTLSLLTLLNGLVVLNLNEQVDTILIPLSTFIGLILAIKMKAPLMKVSYSILFTLNVFVHLISNEVEPFWSIQHFNYLLILGYLVLLFVYLKRNSQTILNQNGEPKLSFSSDVLPVFIVMYFFLYIVRIDYTYISDSQYPYLALIIFASLMLISFFMSEKHIGHIVRFVLIVGFALITINLISTHYVDGFDSVLNLIARMVYAFTIIVIMADIFMEGYIYKKWIYKLKFDIDGLMTIGIFTSLLVLYGFVSQLNYEELLDSLVIVALKTLLLFTTATISIWLSTIRKYRIVRILGYVLLCFAILKLIFYDLASLDLLIRAILFILIGGIGLFLSKRLLENNKKNKD